MKRIALVATVLSLLVLSLTGNEFDTSQNYSIQGQILSRSTMDFNPEVVVSYVNVDKEGQNQKVTLASGRFNEGKVAFEGEIEQATEVTITVHLNNDETLAVKTVVLPGRESTKFALMDQGDSHQLVLVGTSSRGTDPASQFTLSGSFVYPVGGNFDTFFFAHLTSKEFHRDGSFTELDFGTVLLENNEFFLEAEVFEPRVAKLDISRGDRIVWSTSVVIEPTVDIKVGPHHKINSIFVATSQTGRQAKLLDSWQLEENFTSALRADHRARKKIGSVNPDGKMMDDFFELGGQSINVKAGNLLNLAWESQDPLDSLLAMELLMETRDAREALIGMELLLAGRGSINAKYVIELYDKLAKSLDQDLVARRITPRRDRIAAGIQKVENKANLVRGEIAPNFILADLEGKEFSLNEIVGEKELVLIDFWAESCGPCIAAFPKLKELHQLYKNEGFEIVSIAVDTSLEDWQEISQEHELPWIDLGTREDHLGQTSVAYGVGSLPTTYLLDSERRIVRKNIRYEELSKYLSKKYDDKANEN